MKITISHETSLYIDSFAQDFFLDDSLDSVMTLHSLDTTIGALLLGEEVISLSNIRIGSENRSLIEEHPEIPATVIPPKKLNKDIFKIQLEIAKELKNQAEFISFYKKLILEDDLLNDEYIDNTALIASGDMLRSIDQNAAFFANQIESPVCLLHQFRVENQLKTTPNFIKETLKRAWNENIRNVNQLSGTPYFTANIPFFLNTILRECKKPEDIWSVVMEYRNKSSVKRFREWLNDIDREDDFKYLLKELNNLNFITQDIFETKSSFDSFALGLPLSVGLPPISEIKGLIIKNKRHFRFYRRLLKDAVENAQFEKELKRVFKLKDKTSSKLISKISS